jgi:P27 family predicted phage terminase small subunit
MNGDEPAAPAHLSPEIASWWNRTAVGLDETRRLLLTSAAEAWDRASGARELLEAEGIVVTDRFGQPKPHPATTVERDARGQFVAFVAKLDLSETPAGPSKLDELIDRRAKRRGQFGGG